MIIRPSATREHHRYASRSICAVLLTLTVAAPAADFTWDGSTDLWNSLHWLPGPVAGPVGASSADSATINSGQASFHMNDAFGNAGTTATPVVTVNAGGTLASGGFYNAIIGFNINGGTLLSNGGVNDPYGAFALKNTVNVGGSTPSLFTTGAGSSNTISVGSGGGGGTTIFNVADATGNASADLIANTVLNNLAGIPAGITKAGPGTMQLGAANTYTGNTIVTGGTLHVAAGASLTGINKINTQTGGILSIAGTVTMGSNANFDTGAGLTGTTGTVVVNNGGVLNIGAGSGYTGVGGSDTGGAGQKGIGTLTITNGGTLNVAAPGANNGGPGGLDATRLWINPYGSSGVSTINLDGGTLSTARTIQNGSANALVNLNGGTLKAAAALDLLVNLTANVRNGGAVFDSGGFSTQLSTPLVHSTIGGDATIDGGLTKNGAGALTLLATTNGSNYTGNVIVNGGTLALQGGSLGAGPVSSPLGNPATPGRTVTVNAGATLEFRQHDQLGNDAANPQLGIIVNGGTVAAATGSQASGNGPFNILPSVTLNGGTLTSANGAFPTVQSFSLKGDITVTGSSPSTINTTGTPALLNGIHLTKAGGVTFNVGNVAAGVDLTVSAPLIMGAQNATGALIKTGLGTMALTAVNTYNGATTIQQGTLALTGSGSLASPLIDVQAGGTFDISGGAFTLGAGQTLRANGSVLGGIVTTAGSVVQGSGTIDGSLTIGGNLAPGNSPGTITLTNDNLTLGSASSGSFELGGTAIASYDRVVGIDVLTLDGTITVTSFGGFNPASGNTFDLFDFNSVNAAGFNTATDLILPALAPGLSWDTGSFTLNGSIAVVPEPGSALLTGIAALSLLRRRRR